jgi:predicted nucleic acid-binding protein
MIVVADTSPLNYLIQIDSDPLLPRLYGSIVIPPAVMSELSDVRAPLAVRQWLIDVPLWLEVKILLAAPEPALAYLGPGEREAIQLCEELKGNLLLIDERDGRLEARQRGLLTTGTLGVLLAAGELGLIDPGRAYRRLIEETSFRVSATLEAKFLEQIQ